MLVVSSIMTLIILNFNTRFLFEVPHVCLHELNISYELNQNQTANALDTYTILQQKKKGY